MADRQQWVDTYPELATRTNLLEFMVENDSFAAVIMQCITTILEGPSYLKGYKLGTWCLDAVLRHNIERIDGARLRCCQHIPEERANRIHNEAVGTMMGRCCVVRDWGRRSNFSGAVMLKTA